MGIYDVIVEKDGKRFKHTLAIPLNIWEVRELCRLLYGSVQAILAQSGSVCRVTYT
jgi:hypothetical protein